MKCILCEENHARRKYCYCFSCEKNCSDFIYKLKLALLRPKEITDTKRNEITSSIERLIESQLERKRLEQLNKLNRDHLKYLAKQQREYQEQLSKLEIQKEFEETKCMFNEDAIERKCMFDKKKLSICDTCKQHKWIWYVYQYTVWHSCDRMWCRTDGSCCYGITYKIYECDKCISARKFCFACKKYHYDNEQCKICLDCKNGHTNDIARCNKCKKKCRICDDYHYDNTECNPLDYLNLLLSIRILFGKYDCLTYREIFKKEKQYIRWLIKKQPKYEDSWWLQVVIDGLIKMVDNTG